MTTLACMVVEKSLTKNFIIQSMERKKIRQIQGRISRRRLFLNPTIQHVVIMYDKYEDRPKSSVTGLITLLTDVIAYHGLQQSKEQSFIFILISGKWWKHAIWFSYKLRYRPYIWHWPIFTIFVFLLACFMLHISSITYRRILKFSGLLSVAFCGTLHKNQRLLSIICDAKYWYMKYGEIHSHVIFKDPLCLHFRDLFWNFDWEHIVMIYCSKDMLQNLKYYTFMKLLNLEHDLVDFPMALFA